jgi:ribosomal 50S subunit-recycling heat shock protein
VQFVIRLDKFLKLSQLVKRRTAAQEMIEVGAVRVNGRKVKPACDVKVGDVIDVAFPRRVLSAAVLLDDEALLRRRGAVACEMRGERRVEPEENPWDFESNA